MKKKTYTGYQFGLFGLHHLLPALVWLVVLACVVGLFYQRSRRFEVLAIVQGQIHQIAATCTGRLKNVPVGLFDEVKQGQTVAILDTILDNENLQAELAVAAAEIEHLMAQLIPTQERLLAEATNLRTNQIADERRFYVDIENARLQILSLKVQLATDKITLEDLSVEVKIAEDLLKQEAIAPYELQRVEVRHKTMAEKIRENEDMLEQAEADLKQAQHRRDEFAHRLPQHPSVDSALDVIHKQLKVQEQRMEELLARRKPLNLTTPFDGMVSLIQRWPGEAVQANEPILTITELRPTDVVAYAKNEQIAQIREGMVVEIVRNTEPVQIARSQVISVGPAVEQLPIQLWLNPNVPEWGRPFVIKAPPQMKLIVGERVGIRTL